MNQKEKSQKQKSLFSEFRSSSKQEWKRQLSADLKGVDPEKLFWKTREGFDLEPMYFPEDLDGIPHLDTLPGEAPFVRGVSSLGHPAEPWRVSQRLFSENVVLAAGELRRAFEAGQTGSEILVNADWSSERAGGLHVATVEDLHRLLQHADATKHALSFRCGCSPVIMTALFHAWISKNKISWQAPLRITADPLSAILENGALDQPLEVCMHALSEILQFTPVALPGVRSIEVRSDVFHNAGATIVQEIAGTLSAAVEYLNLLSEHGVSPQIIARSMSFTLSVGTDLFMEIGKLRAMRMLWSRILTEFGVEDGDAMGMDMHTASSMWYHTAYDPWVNMLRVTVESMAGAIGGTQSMHTEPFDTAARDSSEFSRRIARNVQIILQDEAYLTKTADPAAGSYYLETLTHSLAVHGWELFCELERHGGFLASIENGSMQDMVEASARERRKAISRRKEKLIGTNQYPNISEKPLRNESNEVSHSDPGSDDLLARYERNAAHVEACLSEIRTSRERDRSLPMDRISAAFAHGAAAAEVRDALGGDIPAQGLIRRLVSFRAAEQFERLRRSVDRQKRRPAVFLATFGPASWRRARATFASGFYGIAGFDILDNPGFPGTDDAAAAASMSGADIVVACSDDESYLTSVPSLIRALREHGCKVEVVVAGYPAEHVDALKNAGVSRFIHVSSDVASELEETLESLHIELR